MDIAINLLKDELEKYRRSKSKSIESFSKGDIDEATHKIHLFNINPKIERLTEAIKKLEEA
jgi:hypothetical protein